MQEATIENGFAKVGKGAWLVGAAQPSAVIGECVTRSLKGLLVPDRAHLHIAELTEKGFFANAQKPFMTQIPCAAPLTVVSSKLLVAPAAARTGCRLLRVIPLSFRNAICTTECTSEWVVMATQSRTTRVSLEGGEILTVRIEAAVAWTTKPPTGFCPKIGIMDIIVPRKKDRNMMLHFCGPGIVWLEGSNAS